jgi:hypothetical protein
MSTFIGEVKLTIVNGYIDVVRADAVEGGIAYNAADAGKIVAAAIQHAKALKVKIKAFVPEVEPSAVVGKANVYSVAALESVQERAPVVLKAKGRPLPYLAFLKPLNTSVVRKAKPQGLGEVPAVKPVKPAKPQGL